MAPRNPMSNYRWWRWGMPIASVGQWGIRRTRSCPSRNGRTPRQVLPYLLVLLTGIGGGIKELEWDMCSLWLLFNANWERPARYLIEHWYTKMGPTWNVRGGIRVFARSAKTWITLTFLLPNPAKLHWESHELFLRTCGTTAAVKWHQKLVTQVPTWQHSELAFQRLW
jgi:hypothetical protein